MSVIRKAWCLQVFSCISFYVLLLTFLQGDSLTTVNVDAELSSVVDEESRDSPVTVTTEKASYIFKDPNFVV